MKFPVTPASQLLLLSAPGVFAQAALSQRQTDNDDGSDYITSVCLPATAPDQSAPAPCVAVVGIETACLPNGTSPLALEAHAQCLCGGSYFAEWLGCRRCLEVHGALSPRNYTYFSQVLSSASQMLCTGTPTAALAALWTQAQAAIPEPTTGDAATTDVKSGDAAVSLYYTASGPQGPGVITGSATAATAVATGSGSGSSSGVATTTTGGSGADAKSTTKGLSATSSSSSNVAAPTGATGGGKGVVIFAAVGGALVAAL
ncbi:hypothetical protein F4819DRAFT_501231 [Hypoxylon fuscum]|nr:hypothetical protein F4819DRAFT_501231 [Hypoxylon fuscum]